MNVINQFESLFFEEYVAAHGVWNLAIENFRGDHSVPIMTIHKSKGLEFPICIIGGMGHAIHVPDKSILTIHPDIAMVMPVVDNEERLVGIITVDDIVDILQEEATEDIEKMAAIVPTDKPYMKTTVFETWKKRIPWLLLLMISATFTGSIITSFEDALSACVVLTAYIPMLMDTGGNAGGQASVTIIRGLSLNEIEFKDAFRVLWKEARVAVLCGLTLAAANFVKLLLLDHVTIAVAAVVCLTLIAAVFIAKVIGCLLPMLAKKIGFDPAVMASPFITTIVDALSLLIYFSIATAVMHI